MQHVALKSSHIVSAGYDSGTGTMHVAFKNGDVHEFEVPEDTFHALVNASSSGAYFHKHIKPLNGRRIS